MSLEDSHIQALETFEQLMAGKDQRYAYTGSTALNLHGIDIEADDIDIVTSEEVFEEIIELFESEDDLEDPGSWIFPNINPRNVKKSAYEGSAKIATSDTLVFEIEDVQFDIIKNAKYHFPSETYDIWEDSSKKLVDFNGQELPVIELEDLRDIYAMGGRDDKVETIETYTGQKEISEIPDYPDHIDYLELGEYGKNQFIQEQNPEALNEAQQDNSLIRLLRKFH